MMADRRCVATFFSGYRGYRAPTKDLNIICIWGDALMHAFNVSLQSQMRIRFTRLRTFERIHYWFQCMHTSFTDTAYSDMVAMRSFLNLSVLCAEEETKKKKMTTRARSPLAHSCVDNYILLRVENSRNTVRAHISWASQRLPLGRWWRRNAILFFANASRPECRIQMNNKMTN